MPAVEELNEKPKMPEDAQSVPAMDGGAEIPHRKFFVSKRATDLGEKNSSTILWGATAAVFVAVVGIFALSHREIPGHKARQATAQKPAQTIQKSSGAVVPGDKPQNTMQSAGTDSVSPAEIENTKSPSSGASASATTNQGTLSRSGQSRPGMGAPAKSLGDIPAFQPPTYQHSGGGNEAVVSPGDIATVARAYADEVTKPSLIFTAQAVSGGNAQGQGTAPVAPITNFGLEPGFHVSAYLESAISTFGGTPVVAIVEYNYLRDGRILIPAGSRVVGKIVGGNATGTVSVKFSEIYLPDGSRVSINAVGLDTALRPLKGKVSGKQTGKTFLLASLTSVGTLGAGFLGTGNNSAISQQSLARDQISANIGNAADQSIQQMQVSRQIIITIPAGTRVEVTFTSPARAIMPEGAISANVAGR